MNVNSLYPTIVTENPEQTIRFFNNFGFEQKHDAHTLFNSHVYILSNGDMEIEIVEQLKDSPISLPLGLFGLRMNVKDIDEAYNELKEKGCTIVRPPFETALGKNMMLQDEQGINITLIQHI